MNDRLISSIQSFTLDTRGLLEREANGQLEGIYGWLPDGEFAPVENYPALKNIEEARLNRDRFEKYAREESEAGISAGRARARLVREAAFTWLNRLVALRMMEERRLVKATISRLAESNAYLYWLADEKDTEARKLHDLGDTPVNQMGEGPRHIAYRRFILHQCAELAADVSVLFDPATPASLLFPGPLLLKQLVERMNSDSLAEAWKPGNEETIGWIYQAFIAKEKAEVFFGFGKGKKVKPDQIAPATQVFTPKWVVKYLIENSLGRLWMEMHPDSALGGKLAYLVPVPAGSKRRMKPVREITFLDPSCGSMHFGLVAFDLFAEMYREELAHAGQPGWPEKPSVETPNDIPGAIIANNIHGIDLDLRAVQLSALTLFLRARTLNPKCAFTDGNLACANVEKITGGKLNEFISQAEFSHPIYERILRAMADKLRDSDNLGSLLRLEKDLEKLIDEEKRKAEKNRLLLPGIVPEQFDTQEGIEEFFGILQEQILRHLDRFVMASREKGNGADRFAAEASKGLRFLRLVGERYDVVTTNPPYIDSRDYNQNHKTFLKSEYHDAKRNFFSSFIKRSIELANIHGKVAMITGQSFMFISSFEEMRVNLLNEIAIETLSQYDYHLFAERVDTAAFVFQRETDARKRDENVGVYFRLVREPDAEAKRLAFESALAALRSNQPHPQLFHYKQKDFDAVPGKPWVYWMTKRIRELFIQYPILESIGHPKHGLSTGKNKRYLRYWWEVGKTRIGFGFTDRNKASESEFKFFPYMKGGTPIPWYGNQSSVVNYYKGGYEMVTSKLDGSCTGHRHDNPDYYFRKGVTWSLISSKGFAARLSPGGFVFDVAGMTCFPPDNMRETTLAVLNSQVAKFILSALNPTINFQKGDIERLPIPNMENEELSLFVAECIELSLQDSKNSETTYDFRWPLRNLDDLQERKQNLIQLETKVDRKVSNLYGLTQEDLEAIGRELASPIIINEEDEPENTDETEEALPEMTVEFWAQSWISYAIGIVLDRFEVGVTDGLGCGDFAPEVVENLKKLVASDGILVSDQNNERDIVPRVWESLKLMLGEKQAREIIATACGEGNPEDLLRAWLDRFTGQPKDSFWRYHFQLYRKRPVYWPLQAPGRRFAVWIFHERLTNDTLSRIRNEIVETRLRLELSLIEDMKKQAESDRSVRKEIDRHLDLADDLREFSNRLREIIERGYTPHIDDGVLLNAAPLHTLLPSWRETKGAWDELESGEYDWAQQAMEYWPDRVQEKCKGNKSFAIAHGREDLYIEPPPSEKKKKRRGTKNK